MSELSLAGIRIERILRLRCDLRYDGRLRPLEVPQSGLKLSDTFMEFVVFATTYVRQSSTAQMKQYLRQQSLLLSLYSSNLSLAEVCQYSNTIPFGLYTSFSFIALL